MRLSEFIDKLDELDVGYDDPDVYIKCGSQQEHVWEVNYFPETEEKWSAVVIS